MFRLAVMLIKLLSGSWQHWHNTECSRRKENGTTGTSPSNWCPGFPKAATSLSNEETQKWTHSIIHTHVVVGALQEYWANGSWLYLHLCYQPTSSPWVSQTLPGYKVENNTYRNMARRREALGKGDWQDKGVMLIPLHVATGFRRTTPAV